MAQPNDDLDPGIIASPDASGSIIVIRITGRKSGKSYRFPVNYIQLGKTLLTISYKNRTWWRNLRSGATVTIRLQRKDVTRQAKVIED